MEKQERLEATVCREIGARTGGEILIGVVGPVRTGKSTLIKQFMEQLVLPAMSTEAARPRARDELPQSAAGRTIMTTEPKFIPENAVPLQLEGGGECRIRLIDCVGYMVDGAMGHEENEKPRMVKSPWFDEEIPFDLAAETGTRKVICEHSTIGIVVTTDGSISEIPREDYLEAEARVIQELQELGKPFLVLLNSKHPGDTHTQAMASDIASRYGVTCMPIDCQSLSQEDITSIIQAVLYEFPIKELELFLPSWVDALPHGHPIKDALYAAIRESSAQLHRLRQVRTVIDQMGQCDCIDRTDIRAIHLGTGVAMVELSVPRSLFYQTLSEQSGLEVKDDGDLLQMLTMLSAVKTEYDKVSQALQDVRENGYGIVVPSIDELHLEPPEIVHQDGRCGVRLQACAPSIQMMKATIHTELSPIVGTEKQSEDLVQSLLADFADDPVQLWESNIFGKSLHELVNDGLQNKLLHIPQEARTRLQETLERVINEGCTGLICILI